MRATISHSMPAFSGQPFSNTAPLCLMPLVKRPAKAGPESFSGSYWAGTAKATFQPASFMPAASSLSWTANCTL